MPPSPLSIAMLSLERVLLRGGGGGEAKRSLETKYFVER